MMRLIITSLQPDTRRKHADDDVGHIMDLAIEEMTSRTFTHRLHWVEIESAL